MVASWESKINPIHANLRLEISLVLFMNPIQAPYIPLDLDTVEKRFVFDYFSLKSALFSQAADSIFPHFITESDAHWRTPIFSDRTVRTPDQGMRLILSASILINPMYGFNANGVWNHALNTAPNLIIPN